MNNICVFDFETDSPNPEICSPVQLSAVIVDPVKLRIVENSEFNGYMKPIDFDDEEYYNKHESTIKWHADQIGQSTQEVLNEWQTYPHQKTVWSNFVDYVEKYNLNQSRKGIFTAPNPAGFNIVNFDMIIINRLCKKYGPVKEGRQNLFFDRDIRDVMHIASYWLDSIQEVKSYSLDRLREFFGMSSDKAHNALVDCKQTAQLLIKFIHLVNKYAPHVAFKGAFCKKK